jgi:Uncharacterized conserved protein
VTKASEPAINSPALFQRISEIWDATRSQAARSVNSAHVQANWLIGEQIVQAEQAGAERADYGKQLLKGLSKQLTEDFGRGFSVSALQYRRAFYLAYPKLLPVLSGTEKQHALRVISHDSQQSWRPGQLHSGLSWTHYRTLLKIERPDARDFYEIEAIQNGWSARQLERQIASLLFDRLSKSRDKDGTKALANEGQQVVKPIDAIKDPYVLEFLKLPEVKQWHETDLEAALLSQLQEFLLELGSGFAFVGRQLRLTLEGDHFYPDLVFYHIKLKCYVIVDLKVGKLNHGDLGQMQLYVNYYDREIKEAADNPSIGLVLCSEKNDAMVRYVLNEDQQQIFASRYQLYMPTEAELKREIERELQLIESQPLGPQSPDSEPLQ